MNVSAAKTAVMDAIQRLCPAFVPAGSPQRTETSLLVPGMVDGRQVIAKHPTDPRPFWRDRCLHEIAVYHALADQRPPVTVPRLLAADEARLLLVVERLPGRPIAAARWPQSPIQPADLVAVIATLRTLHSWNPGPAAFPAVFDYPEQLERLRRDGLFTRADHDLLTALFAEVIEALGWELNHGDAHPGNVLAITDGDHALVDFEFTGLHAPAFDWALLWVVLQADPAARCEVISTARLNGSLRWKAFLVNAALVLVREIESHRRRPSSPTHQARLRALERDLHWIRQQLEQHNAASLAPADRRCTMKLPTRPVSHFYGYDRGTPIDRHYIEQFLAAHAGRVHGDVAEVKDGWYARRFGGDRIRTVTVIDRDEGNDQATLIADLAQPASLPEAAFDCIILTQTVQFFPNPAAALRNCHQALRPGGGLLLTAPTVGRISLSTPEADCWRVTPTGLARLLDSAWAGPVTVTGYGNLRVCLGMLLGEAAEDLTAAALDHLDPGYPLVACAFAERL